METEDELSSKDFHTRSETDTHFILVFGVSSIIVEVEGFVETVSTSITQWTRFRGYAVRDEVTQLKA